MSSEPLRYLVMSTCGQEGQRIWECPEMRKGDRGTLPNCHCYPWLISSTGGPCRKFESRHFWWPGPRGSRSGFRIICLYCTASPGTGEWLSFQKKKFQSVGPEKGPTYQGQKALLSLAQKFWLSDNFPKSDSCLPLRSIFTIGRLCVEQELSAFTLEKRVISTILKEKPYSFNRKYPNPENHINPYWHTFHFTEDR